MSGERTPEERARARWEREAKRAAKRGEPPPPPPPELTGGPAAPPEPFAGPVEPPPAPAVEPPPRADPPPSVEPDPAAGETREWSAAERWEAETGGAAGGAPEHPYEDVHAEPEAVGEPYDAHGELHDADAARYDDSHYAYDEPFHDPADRRPARPATSGHGSRRGRLIAVAAVSGLLVVAVAWFLLSLFQPLKGGGGAEVAVTIPEGAGTGEIAELLEREGVVSSAIFFRLRATLSGRGGDFKAGEFQLREDMSYGAAIDALVEPPPPDTVTVTVPEGLSRREIAARLRGSGLRGDYMAQTRRSRGFDPARYGAKGARDLEGFLFPATYELEPGQSVRALVRQQLAAFQQNFRQVNMRYARSKNLTPYDVVIIASMIDREAMIPRERRLVASVIYNRLSQGIPLGIDATIRFAVGNWSEPLKQSELAIDSGYNTRLNQGLPPGPIGNPGLAALRAAANPARTDYLYYVVKPCGNGAHSFSRTDAEFQRDVARYNAERERRGGKSPTDC